MRCGIEKRKKNNFQGFRVFNFALYFAKIENSEISESFILLKILKVYETQNRKNDLKVKTLTLRCCLRRKNVHFRGFWVLYFALYLQTKT